MNEVRAESLGGGHYSRATDLASHTGAQNMAICKDWLEEMLT